MVFRSHRAYYGAIAADLVKQVRRLPSGPTRTAAAASGAAISGGHRNISAQSLCCCAAPHTRISVRTVNLQTLHALRAGAWRNYRIQWNIFIS